MSPATTCPHCGRPTAPDPGPEPGFGHTVEVVIPATICGDDGPAETILGRERPDAAVATADRPGLGSESEYDPLASPVADPLLETLATPEAPAPPDDPATAPTGIDLAFLAPGPAPQAPAAESAEPRIAPPAEDAPPARSLAMVLLASYASAATIALAYLVWTRPRAGATVVDTMPPAARLDASRRALPPPPIAEGRIVEIGAPLEVGALEVTPLSVRVEPIALENATGGGRDDGGSALVLRLKLRNRSADRAFAPLDPAFLRAGDSGESDTFIEAESGRIGPYPLAAASERAIVGQGFAPLEPGATAEAIVVGDRDATDGLSPAMTWRVKLRVGAGETAVIGVRFSPEDVR